MPKAMIRAKTAQDGSGAAVTAEGVQNTPQPAQAAQEPAQTFTASELGITTFSIFEGAEILVEGGATETDVGYWQVVAAEAERRRLLEDMMTPGLDTDGRAGLAYRASVRQDQLVRAGGALLGLLRGEYVAESEYLKAIRDGGADEDVLTAEARVLQLRTRGVQVKALVTELRNDEVIGA